MTSKTVLVVDDHAPTREASAAYLRDLGYRILEAAHGGEAILHAHEHRPDLALIDIAMPVLDGIETALSLRAVGLTERMRVVGITGCESVDDRARMEALCDTLLLKPCDPGRLAGTIRSLLDG